MKTNYRGFIIEVLPEMGQFVVSCKRLDGSLVEHPDNPEHYEDEESCIEHGEHIIDEFLDE